MLHKNGVPSLKQIKSRFPKKDLLIRPKAITECYEAIPCNPCSTSCPFGAIVIGEDINTPPQVDFDLCTGCGICVYSCPGLAIFTVEQRDDYLVFKIPYEFLPYPQVGEMMHAINRAGDIVGTCEILRVNNKDKQDKTVLLYVKVELKLLYEFVTVRRMS